MDIYLPKHSRRLIRALISVCAKNNAALFEPEMASPKLVTLAERTLFAHSRAFYLVDKLILSG